MQQHPTKLDGWTSDSWRSKPTSQPIPYTDVPALESICDTLKAFPPLVMPKQIDVARGVIASAARGKAFVIQGGDCAENFSDVQMPIIWKKVKLLAEQSCVLNSGFKIPVIQIGRIAGQYSKPRSVPLEVLTDGTVVPAFRGHNINSGSLQDRIPDPKRLLLGHLYAAMTLNTINHMQHEVQALTGSASNGVLPQLFTSHEALHLPYETAMVRDRYNVGATFLWLGERTRQIDGSHVEYLRGLRNPIGVKIGPKTTGHDLVALLNALDPDHEDGKVTIITRLGVANVKIVLPSLIEAVKASGHLPLWMCDPCHGNTLLTPSGIKTRCVGTLLDEMCQTYEVHRHAGSRLGGLHLEQTGEDVTECLEELRLEDGDSLLVNYRSLCDPRLSREQALFLVQQFVGFVKGFESAAASYVSL